ncbi:hypothetical protein RhiXN_04899 [Rhizoctonia solani]|uniref:RRM Nup35-type domain-containing protein n=1 Tax=Rhizoctonia solani TaxID=456999 RepID=A0A8H8NQG3_9AGAM|nr:uncharacterized protein RhiXN_04899 [Rhizoctonia solani]QRW16897.1 hypothetical protein RhiXN_04899 [Rhizoctonia solani]
MFQSQHASTSQPNAFTIDSLNQEQKYVPGYLLSTTQGKSVSGFSNFNNPPLLPEPVARDHGQSTQFGTGSLYARPPPKARDRTAPIVDDDAPPTESLLEGGNFNFSQQHQQAHLQQTLRPTLASTSVSTIGKGAAPTQNHDGAVAVLVSGFYPDRAHSVISQFTAIGESSAPEMPAEGGNWFKITYLNPWDGARALRRDGDIINGDMMISVRLVDPSQASMLGETTPRLAITAAPTEPTPKSPALQTSHAPTAFGRAATLAPSASAFRSTAPVTAQTRPTAASAPGADWGVRNQQEGAQENQSQSGVMGKLSDMIFGW